MGQMTKPWGQHLILDLSGCSRHHLTDAEHLRAWIADLVTTIGMKAFGAPVLDHFGHDSHDAAGFTLMQLIETSNICAHFAENLGQVYVDIFSCKSFNALDAEILCRDYFHPTIVVATHLDRGVFNTQPAQAG